MQWFGGRSSAYGDWAARDPLPIVQLCCGGKWHVLDVPLGTRTCDWAGCRTYCGQEREPIDYEPDGAVTCKTCQYVYGERGDYPQRTPEFP